MDLFLRIAHLDVDSVGAEVTVTELDGTPLAAEPRPDEEANRWAQQRFQSVAGGSVRLRLGTPAGPRAVRVAMVAGGLRREAVVQLPEPRAAGRAAVTVDRVWLEEDALLVAGRGPLGELRLQGRVLARPLSMAATPASP
ncbi:MAG: hypothetical protein R2731_09010 [Nocardioides sp.]